LIWTLIVATRYDPGMTLLSQNDDKT